MSQVVESSQSFREVKHLLNEVTLREKSFHSFIHLTNMCPVFPILGIANTVIGETANQVPVCMELRNL